MPGMLEEYDASGARRAKVVRTIALAASVSLLLGLAGYFGLRNLPKRQKLDSFIRRLQAKDYKAAYALWGCSDQKPCRDYSYERFLRDWGPESPAANASQATLENKATCGGIFSPTGILRVYRFGPEYTANLWVSSEDGNISFAPVIGRLQCTILP
jgi:hypothetical protein